jgi:alkaline phosphatase D
MAQRADTAGMLEREHVRILFGSCIDNPQSHVWDRMLALEPSMLVLLGDAVYFREGEWLTPHSAWFRFQRLLEDPGFAAFSRKVPVLAVWDDHDYGPNDSDASFPFAFITKAAFRKAFHMNPAPPEELSDFGSFSSETGPVRLIVTDSRSGRRYSTPGVPGRLFGEKQLAWVRQELFDSRAAVTILAAGNQILARGDSTERLAPYSDEEAALLAALGQAKSLPVIISGDMHYGEIVELPMGDRSLLDATSSPLTAPPRPVERVAPVGKRAPFPLVSHGAIVGENNFGMVDVAYEPPAVSVIVTVFSADGSKNISAHISRFQ